MTNMQRLLDLGQSVWLDYLSRGMTRSGELHSMIADGLRGMTSNPTIFEHAIGHTSDYDQDLTALANSARTDRDIFETIAIEDVREAADVFRAVFDSTEGGDGLCRSRSHHRWPAILMARWPRRAASGRRWIGPT